MNLYGVNAWALSTYDSKKGLIDNYINPIIGKAKIKDITPRFMDEFYRKLLKVQRVVKNNQSFEGKTVSPRNVREIHKILNCVFNQAVRWELLEANPVSKATLPKCEKKVRDIWTMEDPIKALEVCEDDRLALAIHLAFSCSLRLGEIMGLTWDCLTIDEESIREHNASLYVEKELQRVSKSAMDVLENKDVLTVFPAVLVSDSTTLVLKKPKTQSSIRRVWLPETLARMLADWKKQQEEHMPFVEAVRHLCGCTTYGPFPRAMPQPKEPRPFVLPKCHSDNRRVIQYLMQRGLSEETIQMCIGKGILYEDYRHNCCFVGLDPQGVPRYAMLRSSDSASTFLREVEGSDKRYSFRLPLQERSHRLFLFESAIDCLSFAELQRMASDDWKPDNYLSLSGVYQPRKELSKTPLPIALIQFLQDNPHINHISMTGLFSTSSHTSIVFARYFSVPRFVAVAIRAALRSAAEMLCPWS